MIERIRFDIGDEINIPKERLFSSDKAYTKGTISMVIVTRKDIKYRVYNGMSQYDISEDDVNKIN